MRIKLSILALSCLATSVFAQDRAEFSSTLISGPKNRAASPQTLAFECDLANRLLILAPRVRSDKSLSREISMALARLGRLDTALRIAPDKTAKTELFSMAAMRSIIEGNEKVARGLIKRVPSNKRDELNLLLAQSILMNRDGKREALAILKSLPVTSVSLTQYDPSQFLLGFKIGVTIAEAGDRSAAQKRFDLMEIRLKQAESRLKGSKVADHSMAEATAQAFRGLLVLNRLDVGLEDDALKMPGQSESLLAAAAGHFLDRRQEAKARQLLQKLPPDMAIRLISQPFYGEWDIKGQKRKLPIRESLFREFLPKVSAETREAAITEMAMVFAEAGETRRCVPFINELSGPEQRNKTLDNFRRMFVFMYRHSSGALGELSKKWGREQLLLHQMKVRKLKNSPSPDSVRTESELKDIVIMAYIVNDHTSARNALYELEKIVHVDYPPLPSLSKPVSRELGFAINWGSIGDFDRAERWMNRVAKYEKQSRLNNRSELLLQLVDMVSEPDLKELISRLTSAEWAKLNLVQIHKLVGSLAFRASNTGQDMPPTWMSNLPRADQRAYALARWIAAIRPYETTYYAIPRKQLH